MINETNNWDAQVQTIHCARAWMAPTRWGSRKVEQLFDPLEGDNVFKKAGCLARRVAMAVAGAITVLATLLLYAVGRLILRNSLGADGFIIEKRYGNLATIDKEAAAQERVTAKTIKVPFWSEDKITLNPREKYISSSDPKQERRLAEYADMAYAAQERFTEAGIPCWIDGGTLLGAYRYGGRQLPHDYDIDLCFLQKDAKKVGKILTQMELEAPEKYEFSDFSSNEPGYYMRQWLRSNSDDRLDGWMGVESYRVSADGTMGMRYGTDKVENVFPLVKTTFHGREFWVPKNVEAHLHTRYSNLDPIAYWVDEKNSYVLDLDHPMAGEEAEKIRGGKVANTIIPTAEEHTIYKKNKGK